MRFMFAIKTSSTLETGYFFIPLSQMGWKARQNLPSFHPEKCLSWIEIRICEQLGLLYYSFPFINMSHMLRHNFPLAKWLEPPCWWENFWDTHIAGEGRSKDSTSV